MKKYKYKPKVKPTPSIEDRLVKAQEQYQKEMQQPVKPKVQTTPTRKKSLQRTSTRELRKEARELERLSNKRLQRLEKQGLEGRSSAYQKLQKERGTTPRFDTEGKGKQKLIEDIKAMKEFLGKKTSTPKGVESAEQKTTERLEELGVTFKDKEEQEDFFTELARFKELYPNIASKVKPSEQMKMLKKSYDYQKKKYGEVDEARLFANMKSKIRYAEKSLSQKEERETEELFTRKRR